MCLAIVVALWLAVRTIDPARRFVRLSIAAMLLAFTMAACGGGGGSNPSHPSTPAGTYTLTVTASFNNGTSTVHHDINLTLAVN
jgi:ABC-type glycerol-3-phosphate transport system substrate-binding protein